jgi:hypothetical protein
MSYIGTPDRDNRTLFNGTITVAGIGSTIDLTGYDTALVQVTGIFSGIITFERSLDNVNWFAVLVTELNALNQKTQIETTGIYSIRGEAQYLRYNITNLTGSVTLLIDGNQNIINAADKVAWAMDESNNSPLNVRLQAQNSGIKQDLSGAFILSDAPQPVTVNLTATQNTAIIDTQGYQTIHITTNATFASTTGITFSNDGITFVQAPMSTVPGVWATAFVASTSYTVPVQGRFAKIIATAGGQFTYYLRNIPSQVIHQNLAAIAGVAVSATAASAQLGINVVQVGGTSAVTGGLAGTLGVGGSTAVGVAPTSNPVIAGGIDPGGLGRRLFADATGRLILNPYSLTTSVPSSLAGVVLTTSAGGNIAPVTTAGFDNKVPVSVQDTSGFEGQSYVELLGQILQEMKIMNQQLYELPRIVAAQMNGYNSATINPQPYLGDEPTQMRNDASLFINQQ